MSSSETDGSSSTFAIETPDVARVEAQPDGQVGLRVHVHAEHAMALLGQRAGQIDGGGRLADPALLIRDGDDASHGRPPGCRDDADGGPDTARAAYQTTTSAHERLSTSEVSIHRFCGYRRRPRTARGGRLGCARPPPGDAARGGARDRRHERRAGSHRVARGDAPPSRLGGGQERIEQQHAKGKLTARERLELLLDAGSFVEFDAFVVASQPRLRPGGAAHPGRRRGHRPRHDRRPPRLRLQPGLHGLRRLALGGARREDLQGHGPGHEGRGADHRPQRLGRRAHPGGRRLAGWLRRHLPAQHDGVRGRPADLARSWVRAPVARCTRRPSPTSRSWSRSSSYMFVTGPEVVRAVTHEDVDAEHLGGASVHTTISGVAHLARARRGRRRWRRRGDCSATCPRTTWPMPPRIACQRPARSPRRRPSTASSRRAATSPTTCTRSSTASSTTATSWSCSRLGRQHHRRLRAPRRAQRRHRGAAARRPGRRARHRRLRQGRAVRAHVRRLQRPAADASRTCPASCPASARSTAASSATAPSCSMPTARRRCPR